MIGIEFDPRLTIGSVVELLVIVAGGAGAFAMIKARVAGLTKELCQLKADSKASLIDIKLVNAAQFAAINSEMHRISDILISLADQHRRIVHLEDDVREMKHGRGYVQGERGLGGIGN